MPEILTHSVDDMDKEKTWTDSTGRMSIVLEDDLDIMPLIEPQTVLFKLWVVFEFVESIAGLTFGLLFFFRLASINKPEDVPSYSAAASALVAALSSWCDLILNIIGHGWNPRGWIKYVKNKHIINLHSRFPKKPLTLPCHCHQQVREALLASCDDAHFLCLLLGDHGPYLR